MCPRPGEVAPGAVVTSAEGYCGGKNPEDGICPVVIAHAEATALFRHRNPKNNVLERKSPTTVVYIYDKSLSTKRRVRIQNGYEDEINL
jgi:hypothetical protein